MAVVENAARSAVAAKTLVRIGLNNVICKFLGAGKRIIRVATVQHQPTL
jgi:hypothetical protein